MHESHPEARVPHMKITLEIHTHSSQFGPLPVYLGCVCVVCVRLPAFGDLVVEFIKIGGFHKRHDSHATQCRDAGPLTPNTNARCAAMMKRPYLSYLILGLSSYP